MLDFSKSYFELFDIPERFEVDSKILAERYLVLQQVVHPDRYANASEQERRKSLQAASFVNEALRTLKDPLARAAYLLARRGFHHTTNPIIDSSFLMEQIELRETLAKAQGEPDSISVVTSIIARIHSQRDALLLKLATAIDDERLTQAQDTIYKLQFLDRLCRSAEEATALQPYN